MDTSCRQRRAVVNRSGQVRRGRDDHVARAIVPVGGGDLHAVGVLLDSEDRSLEKDAVAEFLGEAFGNLTGPTVEKPLFRLLVIGSGRIGIECEKHRCGIRIAAQVVEHPVLDGETGELRRCGGGEPGADRLGVESGCSRRGPWAVDVYRRGQVVELLPHPVRFGDVGQGHRRECLGRRKWSIDAR